MTLSVAILATTVLVFAAFGVHAFLGGAYETRTPSAMALWTAGLAAIAATGWRTIGRTPST